MDISFEKNGLYINDDWVSDFEPKVVGIKQHVCLADGKHKKTYEVMVTKLDGSKTEVEEVDCLKDISYFDLWNIPDSLLTNKQKKLLNYKMQLDVEQLKKEQTKTVIEVGQGLYNYKNLWLYGFGKQVFVNHILEKEIIIESSAALVHKSEDSDWQTSLKAYINLLPGVSEIVFYGSLLGAIKPIICNVCQTLDEGIKLDFAISLIGPSGHLKTSMVRKYALWLEDSEMQEVSFRDYRRNSSIIAMIDSLSGQNFLIDDLHEAKAFDVSTRQQEKLDALVRHIGSHKNSANIFVTGETMEKMGIFSCKDRLLQIKIPRMDSEELKVLKRNIGLLPTGYMGRLAALFLESLMKDYDKVQKTIQEYIKQNQNLDKEGVRHDTRTYDCGIFIRLTEELLRKYMCKGLSDVSRTRDLDEALNKNYMIQQKELQREQDVDYAIDVYTMLTMNDECLSAVTDKMKYSPQETDKYFWKDNKAYITKKALVNGMTRYYGKFVSWKNIIDDLDKKALLEEDIDKRSKKFMEARHYVISIDALRKYQEMKLC